MSDEARRRAARRNLIALATVALLPFVASWLLYRYWQPTRFTNYGELIQPLPLASAPAPQALRALQGKWVFLMVDSAACDANCERKLYAMRQVRLTQGKNMHRVERAWLVDDDGAPRPELLERYRGTHVVPAQASGLLTRLPVNGGLHDHIYVVDPLGNVMLRYPRDADPSLIKKDITRLLKTSRIE
jgi:hypothetical protein